MEGCHVCQENVREKQNFLQVREKSGNFEKMSGNFDHLTHIRKFCHVMLGNCQGILSCHVRNCQGILSCHVRNCQGIFVMSCQNCQGILSCHVMSANCQGFCHVREFCHVMAENFVLTFFEIVKTSHHIIRDLPGLCLYKCLLGKYKLKVY